MVVDLSANLKFLYTAIGARKACNYQGNRSWLEPESKVINRWWGWTNYDALYAH